MCWRLEFNKHTSEARNRLSCGRLTLNIIGLLFVIAIGAVAAVVAWKAVEWFPTYKGYDGIYKRIAGGDPRVMNLTKAQSKDCINTDEDAERMVGRMVYKCGNGASKCLLMDFRCDGYDDCGDNSDEENCEEFCKKATKSDIRFTCDVLNEVTNKPEATCMHADYKCDGEVDCTGTDEDRHDEGDCTEDVYFIASTNLTCSVENNWVCADYNQCIRAENTCDGVDHCWDGSDETYC